MYRTMLKHVSKYVNIVIKGVALLIIFVLVLYQQGKNSVKTVLKAVSKGVNHE